ncbi:MAG: hypothetical protein HOQ09_09670 [Gemmatimonadaceae bacterium]|nr:hypothetical protein [Gemmatimonadaceae bacterium]
MSPRSLGAALVTAALLVTGCGPHRGPASSQYAFVVFTNESLNQADVYAFGTAGDRVRLGTVFGAHTDTLRLDLRTISGSGTLSVRARIIATGRTPGTGQVLVHPGDYLRVTLPSSENMLTALVAQRPDST